MSEAMSRAVYELFKPLTTDLGYRPPPPPLPEYDINEEAPKWTWRRIKWRLPPVEREVEWPRVGDKPASDDLPDWRGVIKNNVIETPMPGKYPFGLPIDQSYFWFDTPDYADPFKKLWYSTKLFTKLGVLLLSAVGCYENKKFTWKYHWQLTGRTFVPVFVGGMVASLGVVTIANLRGKKDDRLNYVFGGLCAACVIGRKNYLTFVRHAVMWAPAAAVAKYNAEVNGYLLPTFSPRVTTWGLGGNSAEQGIKSGNLTGLAPKSKDVGDPGRDVRVVA